MIDEFGFVIVRHVNNETTNKYWQEAYTRIRQFYDHAILIVDDNSNPQYLTTRTDLVNCQIINGQYPAVGELLGYYYFYKLHPFRRACVIHDSVFFNQKVDFATGQNVQFLWSFYHYYDEDEPTLKLIAEFADAASLNNLYLNKQSWLGCFGVMSVMSWEFLDKINFRHDLFPVALRIISCRAQRCYFERIFACMCYLNDSQTSASKFGDIHQYCRWGLTFEDYMSGGLSSYPVVKVWTGR